MFTGDRRLLSSVLVACSDLETASTDDSRSLGGPLLGGDRGGWPLFGGDEEPLLRLLRELGGL